MRYGSVCSGIEAASVAWHPLGWEAAWLAEIEPFPSAVLAHHYPGVPNLGDMTRIAGDIYCGAVDAPDILVGGTPCQAFSVAGMRNGLDDARGQLTIKYVELANAIDDVRIEEGQDECIVVWENVPGVLSSKDNAFGCFLGALAGEDSELVPPGGKWKDAGCVFGPQRAIAWRVLDAQYFGVAQRRRRVFVVASARAGFNPTSVLFELEGVRRDSPPSRETGQSIAHPVAPCLTSSGRGVERSGETRGQDPVVAWPAEVACTLNAAFGDKLGLENQHINGGAPLFVPVLSFNSNAQVDQMRFDPELSAPLTCSQNSAVLAFSCKDHGADVGAISPTLRAMGHGASHANAGGQVAVCVTGEITHTLKAEGFDASEDGTGRGQPMVPIGSAVRRLTPRECERLQGFPDDYTLVSHRNKEAADGPRYKALGNSMAVPCMAWIGERIRDELRAEAVDDLI
jgi:DNA (cytosine-5)-methyltransferase 1